MEQCLPVGVSCQILSISRKNIKDISMKTLLEASYDDTLQDLLDECLRIGIPIARDPQTGFRFELWLYLSAERMYA